jgi:hypothetical protein
MLLAGDTREMIANVYFCGGDTTMISRTLNVNNVFTIISIAIYAFRTMLYAKTSSLQHYEKITSQGQIELRYWKIRVQNIKHLHSAQAE